ncbi:MAG: 30S ribosomal protein S1 [Planctomycetaceae bacterium]
MVDRNLIREFHVDDADIETLLGDAFEELDPKIVAVTYDVNQIVQGTIIRIEGDDALIDIGYKSEGIVPVEEWDEDGTVPLPGETVEVLLEEVEDDFGLILLSKRKAARIREWEWVISQYDEGDVVTGGVLRKIKGGLLVNIGQSDEANHKGVNVFLPASQVDIRRPPDIGLYVGKDIECMILKIDESRRNIVVSRRRLIEDKREKMKQELMAEIEEGQVREGVVKNIADFGAFVDLGGIDGLLHITDLTWGRVSHPSEVVKIDDRIEVKILNVDREKEKIALGRKQLTPSPWDDIDTKYPVGARVTGEVVNVMTYGAFVKLEDGIEGLVHISEMSWVKRLQHPSEMVNIGDEVEVVVLGINTDKQEISLGMKQTQPNPWDEVAAKYPPGSHVKGRVRNLTNYGAFIELEEGVDGLLHVSDMSWVKKISHANELLKKGEELECQVLSVDEDRKRIALGLKQLQEDPWETEIPERFQPGMVVNGKVTKITNFGVFVELQDELEGLLHISELADYKVENPEDVVKVGEEIEVRVLRIDSVDRKIGLSRRLEGDLEETASEGERPALLGGTGEGESGPLFSLETSRNAPTATDAEEEAPTEGDAEEEDKD